MGFLEEIHQSSWWEKDELDYQRKLGHYAISSLRLHLTTNNYLDGDAAKKSNGAATTGINTSLNRAKLIRYAFLAIQLSFLFCFLFLRISF